MGFAVSTVCIFWVAIGAIVLHVVQPSLPFSTEGCAAVEINASAAFSGYNTIQNLLQEPSSLGITSLPPADNLMEWLVCVSVSFPSARRICLPVCPCLPVCLTLFVCLSVHACPSARRVCLPVCPCLPVCQAYLSACLSVPTCLPGVFVDLSVSVCPSA